MLELKTTLKTFGLYIVGAFFRWRISLYPGARPNSLFVLRDLTVARNFFLKIAPRILNILGESSLFLLLMY